MPADKSRSGAAKRATTRTSTERSDHGRVHEHAGHDHVEFLLSKKTAAVIDTALKGLTPAQQKRVLAAIDRVGDEAGETVGRWVEENVVANVNELLAVMAPVLAGHGRWDELRGILRFLKPLDVPVDHARLHKEIGKARGAKVAGEFRKQVGRG